MARQSGLIKIKGTLDNVSFYKTKDGHLARMKTSVDATRIKNDPAFERTRENNSEFGNAATAGKLVRDAVRSMSITAADGRVASRMTQLMTRIKNLDSVSPRGDRNVAQGILDPTAINLLKGFEFNKNALLSAILFKPYGVDTNTGEITINDLKPQLDVVWPQGATHISLTGSFVGLDFSTGDQEMIVSNTVNLPIDMTATNVVLTPATAPSVGTLNMFMLRVEFFQEINGVQYTLKNNAYNALRVVDAQ